MRILKNTETWAAANEIITAQAMCTARSVSLHQQRYGTYWMLLQAH